MVLGYLKEFSVIQNPVKYKQECERLQIICDDGVAHRQTAVDEGCDMTYMQYKKQPRALSVGGEPNRKTAPGFNGGSFHFTA